MHLPVFATSYFGSIEYFSALIKYKEVIVDQYEWFVKQNLRTRCIIAAPNGLQKLIIPYSHFGSKKICVKDVTINYGENWHKHQLKSLSTAYNSSPFYEFYKDEFSEILLSEIQSLIELNTKLTLFILKKLKVKVEIHLSDNYIETEQADYRKLSNIKETEIVQKEYIPKQYLQVYSHKNGFAANLSIIDLLFNQGPNSVNYL